MENVILTPKEQTRLQVLNSLLAEHMTLDQAATLMGVSPRHTRRILAAYREKGIAAVAHGHRSRKPANATPESVVSAMVHLARTRYAGANHTHLSELLREREGIDIGRTTLRRILVNAGLSSPRRRRPPKRRVRRQRMPREGMLIHLDGSHHRWLGEDGTSVRAAVCSGRRHWLRGQCPVLRAGGQPELFPVALGTDTAPGRVPGPVHRPPPVFKHQSEYQPAGTPTQFGRAMEELGIQLIFALSPQAKGRVERTAGRSGHRRTGQGRVAAVPAAIQPAFPGSASVP